MVAFPIGHRFAERERVHVSEMHNESYLSRVNCEFRDHLDQLCQVHGVNIQSAYRSEREDWIQTMIAAGIGVCFIPEYSATHRGSWHGRLNLKWSPGVACRFAGRAVSPPAAALMAAVASYPWAEESECAATS